MEKPKLQPLEEQGAFIYTERKLHLHETRCLNSTGDILGYISLFLKIRGLQTMARGPHDFIRPAANIQKPYKSQFYQSVKIEVWYIFGLL